MTELQNPDLSLAANPSTTRKNPMTKTTAKAAQQEVPETAQTPQEAPFTTSYYVKQLLKEGEMRLPKKDFDDLADVLLLSTKVNLRKYADCFLGAGSSLPFFIDVEPLKAYTSELNRVLSYRERSALKGSMKAALAGIPSKYHYNADGRLNIDDFNFTRALGCHDYSLNAAIELLKRQERELTIDKDVRTFLLDYIGRQTGGFYLNIVPRGTGFIASQGSEQKYHVGVQDMKKVELSTADLYVVARTMTYPLVLARLSDAIVQFVRTTPALSPVAEILPFYFEDPSSLAAPRSLNDVKWNHKQNEQLFSIIVLFQYLIQHLDVTDLSADSFPF